MTRNVRSEKPEPLFIVSLPVFSVSSVRPIRHVLDEDCSAYRISLTRVSFPSFSFILCFFVLLTLSVTKLLQWNAFPQVSGWGVRGIIVSRVLVTYLSLRHIL